MTDRRTLPFIVKDIMGRWKVGFPLLCPQNFIKQRKSNIFFLFELDLVLVSFITLVPSNKENCW